MTGEYLRLTGAELRHAIEDPDWALDFADSWREAADHAADAGEEWDGADPIEAHRRCFTSYKAWDAIGFLLRRHLLPVDVVHGAHAFTGDDTDWGYGPPRYLTGQEVAQAAAALDGLPYADLVDGVTAADLAAAGVYPMMWDEPDALAWIGGVYESLGVFFADAAASGDSMLIWLA